MIWNQDMNMKHRNKIKEVIIYKAHVEFSTMDIFDRDFPARGEIISVARIYTRRGESC